MPQIECPGNLVLMLVIGLATWRLTHLFMYETGPWRVITRFRAATGVRHDRYGQPEAVPDGNVFECFWCLSMWVAIVTAIIGWLAWWALVPFALSGAAILIEVRKVPNGKS